MRSFGNLFKIIDADNIQLKFTEEQKELERIVYLTDLFCKEHKLIIEEGIGYIMEHCGYKKCNYIPSQYNGTDLLQLGTLTLRYMRKYMIRPEQFIYKFMENYLYCKKNGYHYEISQKTLDGDNTWVE